VTDLELAVEAGLQVSAYGFFLGFFVYLLGSMLVGLVEIVRRFLG